MGISPVQAAKMTRQGGLGNPAMRLSI